MGALIFAGMLLAGVWFFRGGDKRLVITCPSHTLFFSPLWWASGGLLICLASYVVPADPSPPVRVLLGATLIIGLLGVAIGAVALVWLPLWLCPPWYREWVRDGGREDAFSGPEHWTRLERWSARFIQRNQERHERRRRGQQ